MKKRVYLVIITLILLVTCIAIVILHEYILTFLPRNIKGVAAILIPISFITYYYCYYLPKKTEITTTIKF